KQAQQQAQQQVEIKPELSKPSVFASLSMRSQHKRHRTGLGLMAALIVALCGVLLLPQSGNSVASQIDQLSMEHIVIDTPQGSTAINDIALIAGDNPTEALLPQIETPVSRITSQQATEPALSRLSFQFTEDCWVEVYDGNNERIFASLKKSDDLLELEGKPPFKVTLGYAPGVSLSYNGQPIEIGTTDSRRHLTKLVLGNS
ncbi:MAG: DUF4115 domain-containing protein, partial [Pseudomonadales bacterium]|nr:DUF4115 domain-containing protein [Pseudomonadales bacterium]